MGSDTPTFDHFHFAMYKNPVPLSHKIYLDNRNMKKSWKEVIVYFPFTIRVFVFDTTRTA
jgi:hypothetical protein